MPRGERPGEDLGKAAISWITEMTAAAWEMLLTHPRDARSSPALGEAQG